MLKAILGFLGGGIVKQFMDPLLAAYQLKVNAANDSERLAAEQQIRFFEGQIELARTAAENDKWWSPRTLMAYCTTLVVAKLLVWDTVLGLGVTPNPGATVTGIVLTIVGFHFGSKVVSDIGSRLLTGLLRK